VAAAAVGGLVLGAFGGSLLAPATRELTYLLNTQSPNLAPDVGHVVDTYFRGYMSRDEMLRCLSWQGITTNSPILTGVSGAWRKVLNAMRPPMPDDIFNALYSDGLLNRDKTNEILHHMGLWMPAWRDARSKMVGLPPFDWLLQQKRLGTIKNEQFIEQSSLHGVGRASYIEEWLHATSPLSAGVALDLWRRGLIDGPRASQHVSASGIVDANDVNSVTLASEIPFLPQIGEILRQYRLGLISQEDAAAYLDKLGLSKGDAKRLYTLSTVTFPVDLVNQLLLRGFITSDRAIQHLRSSGLVDDGDLSAVAKLRYVQPSYDTVLAYLPRASSCYLLPTLYGANAVATPKQVVDAADATGTGQQNIGISNADGPVSVSQADLAWAAHWSRPNTEDVIEGFKRLTERRCEQLRAAGYNVNPIPDYAVSQVMQSQGCSPGFVDYVRALSLQPIQFRMLRQVYDSGVMSDSDLIDRLIQVGLIRHDAELMQAAWKSIAQQKLNAPLIAYANEQAKLGVKAIVAAYELGSIDAGQAFVQLVQYGLNAAGANHAIALADAQRSRTVIEKSMNAIREDYLHGAITIQEVVPLLEKAGIVPDKAAYYATQWQLERPIPVQHANSTKVLSWLKDGLITAVNATQRLLNLGWQAPDVKVLIVEAEQQHANFEARRLAAQQKAKAASARQLEGLVNESVRQTQKLRSALRQQTSIATLQRWFRKGVINDTYFINRMLAMGDSLEQAHAALNDAIVKLPAQQSVDTDNSKVKPVDQPVNPELPPPVVTI
jgi:hypothetical protein